jgi:hypothetical protein
MEVSVIYVQNQVIAVMYQCSQISDMVAPDGYQCSQISFICEG